MDAFIDFLSGYGYWGMLIAAFLAGSFFPFSSEAIMIGLMAAGLHVPTLILYATAGNVCGGMFNYGAGRMGRLEWIEKYLHVSKEKLERAQRFMAGKGAWVGFFAFIPILGSAITVVMGLTRANVVISLISMTAGKLLRYIALAYGMQLIV